MQETSTEEKLEKSEPEVLDASKLFDGRLIDDMPDVKESAIAAEEEKPQPASSVERGSPAPKKPSTQAQQSGIPPVDSKGRLFDPILHETNEDNTPRLRQNGQLSIRRHPLKSARRISRVATAAELGQEPADGAIPAPGGRDSEILAGAATCAGLQLMFMKMALGPKCGDDDAQKTELVAAWVGVFKHYEIGAFHPLVGLAMVSGGIVVASMQHEESKSSIKKLGNWLQHKALSVWQWFTGRRKPEPIEDEPAPAKSAA